MTPRNPPKKRSSGRIFMLVLNLSNMAKCVYNYKVGFWFQLWWIYHENKQKPTQDTCILINVKASILHRNNQTKS